MTLAQAVLQDAQNWYTEQHPLVQSTAQATIIVVVSFVVISIFNRRIRHWLEKLPRVDRTALRFVIRTFDMVAWVIVAGFVLAAYGVDPTALLGGLAIGGFILGFALKDTLGNLAAGVMLLFYRPFNVDDVVTVGGETGVVVQLGMALTTVRAFDGRIITIPNGKTLGDTIQNHTRHPVRRTDIKVGIGYDDDIDTATRAILEALPKDPRVLADPAPAIWITSLGDNSIEFLVCPWVNTPDFATAKTDLHVLVKRALEAAGCTIPFPQRDVHLYRHDVAGDGGHGGPGATGPRYPAGPTGAAGQEF